MIKKGLDIDDDGVNQGLLRIDKGSKTTDRDEADGESDDTEERLFSQEENT